MKLALNFDYHSIYAYFIELSSLSKNVGVYAIYVNRRLRIMWSVDVQHLHAIISLTMYDTCHQISN